MPLRQLRHFTATQNGLAEILVGHHVQFAGAVVGIEGIVARQVLGRVDQASALVGRGADIFSRLTARDRQNASWSRSAHWAGLTRLGLVAPAQWTAAQARELDELVAGMESLSAQDPSNAAAVVDLSQGLRLKALRSLATGDVAGARQVATDAHRRMSDLVACTDYSAQRLAELARAAEVLGTTQAAGGDHAAALATWTGAADLLDSQAQQTFEFHPVRRLLAINLGQSGRLATLQQVLDQAGYRDPRMDPAYTLTGAFRPEQDTTTRGSTHAPL